MSASSKSTPAKRKHCPSPELPAFMAEDLTRDHIDLFFDTVKLTDRQRLRWALQTEQRVRLAKLQSRDDFSQVLETLSCSKHLFEVYPELEAPPEPAKNSGNARAKSKETSKKKTEAERRGAPQKTPLPPNMNKDRYSFGRKCHPTLACSRHPDQSMDSTYKLDLSSRQTKYKQALSSTGGKHQKAPVPPNMLFFEIILEAYMGYTWDSFHADDVHLPRCAVMGGTVVAALTGWRDEHVLQLFSNARLEDKIQYADLEDDYAASNRSALVMNLSDCSFSRSTRGQNRREASRPRVVVENGT